MRRLLFSAVLLLIPAAARGQDMPLYTVLIKGEGWKVVEKNASHGIDLEMPYKLVGTKQGRLARAAAYARRAELMDLQSKINEYFRSSPEPARFPESQMRPLSVAESPDGGKLYVGFGQSPAVWAFRVGADGKLSGGDRYCPLRLRKGQDWTNVTGLATDRVGRVFAATPSGIHFFDPTGRFSGLIFLPEKGSPTNFALENDKLVVQMGDTKYTRKVNTRAK